MLLLLNPSITFRQESLLKPNIGFGRDASLSFARRDAYRSDAIVKQIAQATGWDGDDIRAGSFSRAQILNRALSLKTQSILESIREKGAVRIVDFSDAASDVALLPAKSEKTVLADHNTETTGGAAENSNNEPEPGLPTTGQMPPLVANGARTDISHVLQEFLSDSNRLSAVVLFSDGQDNGTEDPVGVAQRFESLRFSIGR